MGKFYNYFRSFLQQFDLFPATHFLKYKDQSEYKTATGGFVSLAVIIVCITLFYNLGTQTLNKQIIKGSVSYSIQMEPQSLPIQFTAKSNFMFAVGIQGLNLSLPMVDYFNISLRQNFFSPIFQVINSSLVPLIPCTAQHFSYDKDMLELYYRFGLSSYLCPPFDFQFSVGGKATSQIFSQFSINVEYCNNTINPKCIDQATLKYIENKLGGFILSIPIISTIVNAQQQSYKQVFLQDRNFFYFTSNYGLKLIAQIQQYQIDTDISILPYTSIESEYITTIPNLFQAKYKPVFNHSYVQVIFSRSSTSTRYTRTFNKIDQYFSYIGGLVATIVLFFFIFKYYSEKSYALNIASQIYYIQDEDFSFEEFNFLHYIGMGFKKICGALRINFQFQKCNEFHRVAQEMQKQLNVEYLLKRIGYIEDVIETILPKYQTDAIYLIGKKTFSQAQLIRKKSDLYTNLKETTQNLSNNYQLGSNFNEDQISKTSPHQLKEKNKQQSHEQSLSHFFGELFNHQNSEISRSMKQSLRQVLRQQREGNSVCQRIMSKISKIVPITKKDMKDCIKQQPRERNQNKSKHNQCIQFEDIN